MIRKDYIYLVLCLLLLSLQVSAQQLKGRIIDAETGEGVPYASVIYKGHNVAVISNLEGEYSIARHKGWKLTFSAVGYKSEVITVTEDRKSVV